MKTVCGRWACFMLEDADAATVVNAGIGYKYAVRPEREGRFITYSPDSAEARCLIEQAAGSKAAEPVVDETPSPVASTSDAVETEPAATAKRGPGRPSKKGRK